MARSQPSMSDAADPDSQTKVEPAPIGGEFAADADARENSAWSTAAISPKDGSVPDVLGKYRIDCRLASGGMGSIYIARRCEPAPDDEPVAIKCIHSHLSMNPAFVAMFIDEARITSQVSHPSICRVLEYGLEGQQPYLVMEFIVGENLVAIGQAAASYHGAASKASSDELCPFEAFAAGIIASICDGLHAAHQLCDERGHLLGVVHRDVSPANLFVTYDGGVRVVDFGVAKAAGRSHETVSGVVKGKFAYMSPEQMAGHDVDRRTDIWSVGVVLFELLARRRLFRRQTDAGTVHAVLHEGVPRLDVLVPSSSPELAGIVARCLTQDRAARYANAADLAADLRAYLARLGHEVGPAQVAAWMARLLPDGRQRKSELLQRARSLGQQRLRQTRPERLRHVPVLVFAAAVMLLVGASFALLFRAHQGPNAQGERPASEGERTVRVRSSPAPNAHAESPPSPQSAGLASATAGSPANSPLDARAPSLERASAERRTAPRPRPLPARAPGMVNVATPGGWAELFVRGKLLGTAPGRYELPAGDHRLEVKPFGTGASRYMAITVRPGELTRVSIPLATTPAR